MAEHARLAAMEPYDVAAVQDSYAGCSPRDAYVRICERLHCTPVACVKKVLPAAAGAWGEVEALDFSLAYVGPQGAIAVAELCRCLPRLASLSLADNYLVNDTVWHVVQMAMHHPSLERIDLSRNEYISWTGAMCLAELVVRNAGITLVDLHGTTVAEDVIEAIYRQTRLNAVAKFRSTTSGQPCPPVHPAAVYIRSLKLFFLKHQELGNIDDAALLESGVEELLRVSGRSNESALYSDKYFATLKARAPVGELTLEAFLILLLIDGSTYDGEMVAELKRVFVLFNVDATAPDLLYSGFVLARDLAEMMGLIYGAQPSAAEMATVRRRLALSTDTTLRWGEFLYLTYPRGPQPGDRLCGMTCTPLVRPIEVMHY